MAINPNTNPTMAGRITAPNAAYPYGSSKDESGAGVGDGTPYFKGRADDIFGMQQALLSLASIVPSGSADSVTASQYAQALVELASGRAQFYDETGAADAYVLAVKTNQYAPASLFDGLTVVFEPGNVNTGASTINVASLGVKDIKLPDGTDPAAGDINGRTTLLFDSSNDRFELVRNETLGKNQSWADLTGSRSDNVIYTNTTGRSIMISIKAEGPVAGDSRISLEVDGINIAGNAGGQIPLITPQSTVTAIVPDGSTYRVGSILSTEGTLTWYELR